MRHIRGVEDRDHDVGRRGRERRREHAALPHHDQDPLETQREAAGWNALVQEHAHQVVVTAAAAKTSGEIRHVDLHDRARVVRQSAREAEIDAQRGLMRRSPVSRRGWSLGFDRRLTSLIERQSHGYST